MLRELVIVAALLGAPTFGAVAAGGSGNPINDRLLAMSPDQQAKMLSRGIKDCVGMEAFSMGVVSTAKFKSLAYWSVRCKDGRSFAIQLAPDPKATPQLVDCRALQGSGKECFKKF